MNQALTGNTLTFLAAYTPQWYSRTTHLIAIIGLSAISSVQTSTYSMHVNRSMIVFCSSKVSANVHFSREISIDGRQNTDSMMILIFYVDFILCTVETLTGKHHG